MSHRATNWAVQQRGLKPAVKIVLWHPCDRHNPDRGCFPSQAQLAYDAEITRRTLNVDLDELERAGLIQRTANRSGDAAAAFHPLRAGVRGRFLARAMCGICTLSL